jgi:hypothetical protein
MPKCVVILTEKDRTMYFPMAKFTQSFETRFMREDQPCSLLFSCQFLIQ